MITFNQLPDDLPDDFPIAVMAHANDPEPLATDMLAIRLTGLLREVARDPDAARRFIALTASLHDRRAEAALDMFRSVEAVLIEWGEIAGATAL